MLFKASPWWNTNEICKNIQINAMGLVEFDDPLITNIYVRLFPLHCDAVEPISLYIIVTETLFAQQVTSGECLSRYKQGNYFAYMKVLHSAMRVCYQASLIFVSVKLNIKPNYPTFQFKPVMNKANIKLISSFGCGVSFLYHMIFNTTWP